MQLIILWNNDLKPDHLNGILGLNQLDHVNQGNGLPCVLVKSDNVGVSVEWVSKVSVLSNISIGTRR